MWIIYIYFKRSISGNCDVPKALVSGYQYSVSDDQVSFSTSYNGHTDNYKKFRLNGKENR